MTSIVFCCLSLLLPGNAFAAQRQPLPFAELKPAAHSSQVRKLATNISTEAAHALWCAKADVFFLDVRTVGEYNAGHIEGALNMPWPTDVMALHNSLPNKQIIVYCASGSRSAAASAYLTGAGHSDIFNMLGAYSAWLAQADCPDLAAVKPGNWRLYR